MSRHEQKIQTRKRILDAAGRSFRRGGFGGIGVDGLSKEAGVTSGAFYTHFDSKAAAFREIVVQGVTDVVNALQGLRADHPHDWWSRFVRFYLHERRKCDLADSCGLQSLSSEVARADEESKVAFTQELMRVAAEIVAGNQDPSAPASIAEAYAALGALIGTVSLARAVNDATIAKQIATATEHRLLDGQAGSRARTPAQRAQKKKAKPQG
jgi:AcrR family transcriptional regulator